MYQLLFTLSKNIYRSQSYGSALMFKHIAHVIFNRDYLKILIFELQNLSSSTFSGQSTSYLAVVFLRQFRREWLSSIFELGL